MAREVMNTPISVFVMNYCNYFNTGLKNLIGDNSGCQLVFLTQPEDIIFNNIASTHIVLVLDVSSSESLRNFKNYMDFLIGVNSHKRIGVIVSKLNAYLTLYISKKFGGRVTFFNSHNFNSGLFIHNFSSWVAGRTFNPMRPVVRYRDCRYGFSLNEWLCLIIPLSGETIQEMSGCLRISEHALYQIRQKALKKIGIRSYREFCEMFINGSIKIENETISRR